MSSWLVLLLNLFVAYRCIEVCQADCVPLSHVGGAEVWLYCFVHLPTVRLTASPALFGSPDCTASYVNAVWGSLRRSLIVTVTNGEFGLPESNGVDFYQRACPHDHLLQQRSLNNTLTSPPPMTTPLPTTMQQSNSTSNATVTGCTLLHQVGFTTFTTVANFS